ncbi:MAG: hypothetical protein IKJ11_04885 [Clostridia bacterium]|nr:hypothetical protein [Clostridia bacterium]
MIEASFDSDRDRQALASGAYQYDTGQRLRMHGLPSPQELAEADDFLSGNIVTVQVHYGFKGESQTETRLALWDEQAGCYLAAIPDEYLQRNECVHAYVYVSYGLDETGNGRTKTMYTLTMRPISRPAPNNVATQSQWEAWALKADETDMAVAEVQTAGSGALAAATAAEEAGKTAEQAANAAGEAAQEAEAAVKRMMEVSQRWKEMTVNVISQPAGTAATAELSGGVLTLGVPQGSSGEKGETGDTGPADIALTLAEGVLTIMPI